MKKKNDINILDSRVFADATHKNDRKRNADAVHKNDSQVSESGRSIVEILGVLAIIGVLSIGGIVGYSYGMDKYRTNQTINDVMLRAVDIITHAGQGENFNDEAWPDKNPVGYATSFVEDEDGNIGIQITGVPSRVCQMVGDGLKTTAEVYVDNADYATAEDPCNSSEENTMSFFFEPVETVFECDPECGTGEFCRWGECVSEKIEFTKWPTDSACSSDTDCEPCGYCYYDGVCQPNNGQDCTINTANDGMCYWGECLPKGCTYDTNKCTGKNEYCASPNSSCTEAFPSGITGTCVKADFKPITVEDKEYWVSNTSISWWDADVACKALGRDGLIGVSDLVNDWNGDYDYENHELTALGKALQSHLGTDYWVWTSDDYDSCLVLGVGLGGGEVYDYARSYYDYSYHFAVCR